MADNSQDRISSIIDLQATGAEVDALKKQVSELVSTIRSTSINIMDAKSVTDVSKMSKELDILIDKTNTTADTTKRVVTTQRELDKAMMEGRIEKQKYNAELKREIELQNASNGSIAQAKAAIKELTAQRDNLDLTTAEGIEKQKVLNSLIDQNTDFIKENVDAASRQRLNVGNYQGSAKIIVEALKDVEEEIAKLQTKQQGLQNLSRSNPIGFKVGSANANELNAVNAQLGFAIQKSEALHNIVDNPKFLNIAENVNNSNQQLKFFTQQLIELQRAGLQDTETFKKIQAELAELTDTIADTKQEIKALSSDTRTFDLFAGSVSFVADAFQTAAGAAALFGGSEDQINKATRNLIAIQSIANGVKGVANELTTKGTAANKLYNFVLSQTSVLFGTGATAAARFSAALKLTGIGFVITGISTLISKLNLFGNSNEDAAKQVEKLNKQLEKQRTLVDEDNAALDAGIKLRVERLKQQGADETKIFQETQEIRKTQFQSLVKNVDDVTKQIEQKEKELNTTLENAINGRKSLKNLRALGNAKNVEEELKALREEKDIRSKAVVEKEREIALAEAQEKTRLSEEKRDKDKDAADKAKDDAKKDADLRKKIREANLQAEFKINEIAIQQAIDFNKEIFENENLSFDERLHGLLQYTNARKELIDARLAYELKKEGLTNKQKEALQAEHSDEILRLERETSKNRIEIHDQLHKKLIEIGSTLSSGLESAIKNSFDNFQKQLEDVKAKSKELFESEKEIKKQRKELYKELYSELGELVTDFLNASNEKQLEQLEQEKAAIDEKAQKEIDFINQTTANKEDAANRITIVEKQAAADKAVLDHKQQEVEKKKQGIERLGKIAEITGNTVQGVMALQVKAAEIRAQAALLASNPLTLPLAGIAFANAALVQSQIPILIAISAAQLLKLAIPKFAGGGVHTKGGPLIVGDGGRSEALELPDGTIVKTPDSDTLMTAPKGTKIHSDFDRFMSKMTVTKVPTFGQKSVTDTSTPLIVNGLGKIEKAVKQIPQPIIKVDNIISKKIRG